MFSKNSLFCPEFLKKKNLFCLPPSPTAFGRIYTHTFIFRLRPTLRKGRRDVDINIRLPAPPTQKPSIFQFSILKDKMFNIKCSIVFNVFYVGVTTNINTSLMGTWCLVFIHCSFIFVSIY